ncbi:hypothetical protein [Streptomyces sp. NPDC053720]|uniref:hypothetical protein n=1 Tax=Streptomyces sp. NPDC053720 TaxID=3154855 RepID=UPI003430F147
MSWGTIPRDLLRKKLTIRRRLAAELSAGATTVHHHHIRNKDDRPTLLLKPA